MKDENTSTFEKRYIPGQPFNNTKYLKYDHPAANDRIVPFEEGYVPGKPYNNTANLRHDKPIDRKI